MLIACGISDIGPVRKTNEDSFAVDEQHQLLVVADGMGGHRAGEVASSLAVESITAFIRRSEEPGECSWPYGIDPLLSFCSNRLRTAIHLANRRVFREAERFDEYTGMGTTVVCALVSGAMLTIGHAGDSRLYVHADGTLTQLTTDDTWEGTVLAEQPLSEPAAAAPSMRHVLTNVLGAREGADVHIREHALRGGETILLCSDGLHNVMKNEQLCGLLSGDERLDEKAERLIKAALTRGSRDNITVVLARYKGE